MDNSITAENPRLNIKMRKEEPCFRSRFDLLFHSIPFFQYIILGFRQAKLSQGLVLIGCGQLLVFMFFFDFYLTRAFSIPTINTIKFQVFLWPSGFALVSRPCCAIDQSFYFSVGLFPPVLSQSGGIFALFTKEPEEYLPQLYILPRKFHDTQRKFRDTQ